MWGAEDPMARRGAAGGMNDELADLVNGDEQHFVWLVWLWALLRTQLIEAQGADIGLHVTPPSTSGSSR
jgi:hypothetical protein